MIRQIKYMHEDLANLGDMIEAIEELAEEINEMKLDTILDHIDKLQEIDYIMNGVGGNLALLVRGDNGFKGLRDCMRKFADEYREG